MATFRVGQRVRKIAAAKRKSQQTATMMVPNGAQGTVDGFFVHGGMTICVVRFDGYDSGYRGNDWQEGSYGCESCILAPLTDPGFEQFMEKVMKPINEKVSA